MPKEILNKREEKEREAVVSRIQEAGKAYKKISEEAAKSEKSEDKSRYTEQGQEEIKKIVPDVPLLMYYYPTYDYPGYDDPDKDVIALILNAYHEMMLGLLPETLRDEQYLPDVARLQKDRGNWGDSVLGRVRKGGKALMNMNEKFRSDMLTSAEDKNAQRRRLVELYAEDIEELLVLYPKRDYMFWDSQAVDVIIRAYLFFKENKDEGSGISGSSELIARVGSTVTEKEKKNGGAGEIEKIDIPVSGKQKKGLNEISKWMFRNSNDTGAISLAPSQERFVRVILSLPDRMRLYMYYLIENKKRHNPSIEDMVMSQTDYIPNLNAFKNQMVATKWKMWKRIDGSYVYWNKLEETLQIARSRTDMIALFGAMGSADMVERLKPKVGQAFDDKDGSTRVSKENMPGFDREMLLYGLLGRLFTYKNLLAQKETGKKVDEEKLEAEKKSILDEYTQLVSKDNEAAAEESIKDSSLDKAQSYIGMGKTGIGLGGNLSSVGSAAKFIKWHIADLDLVNLNLSSGIFSSVAGVAALAGTIAGIINLVQSGGEKTDDELTGEIFSVVTNFVAISKTIISAVFSIKNKQFVGELAMSAAGKAAKASADKWGGVAGAITGGVTMLQGMHQSDKAASQRQMATDARSKMTGLSETESDMADEIMALKGRISDSQESSGALKAMSGYLQMVGGIFAAAGVTGPVGAIFSGIGTAISLAVSVKEFFERRKNRQMTIDTYIKLDELDSIVRPKVTANSSLKGYLPVLRDQIRQEAIAALGFSSEDTLYVHITRTYARFLLRKAFYDESGNPLKEKTEKNEPFIEMIQSFGLKVVFPKKDGDVPKPDVDTLAKKMKI